MLSNPLRSLFWILVLALLAACRAVQMPATGQEAPSPAIPTTQAIVTTPVQPPPAPQFEPTLSATDTRPAAGPPPASPTPRAQADCPASPAAPAAAAATLEMGHTAGLPASTAGGERLVIHGTVYARDCTPLEGVRLNLWQTDAAGEYGPGHGTQNNLECCYFQGSVETDAQGRFTVITVKPGYYKGEQNPPPAHIHVEISYPGAPPGGTEFVFAGDPHLPNAGQAAGYTLLHLAQVDGPQGPHLQAAPTIILDVPPPPKSSAGVRTFQIVSGHSQASYSIREKFADLVSKVTAAGVTDQVEGLVVVDPQSEVFGQVITMTVNLRALRSDDESRDEKLAERWLVTNAYPHAYFTSTGIQNASSTYREGVETTFLLHGDLTIRDITRPVTFESRATLEADTLTGEATTTIRMTDFGIAPPDLLGFVTVEDEVKLTVNLVARELPG